jgi:hypothetical protein
MTQMTNATSFANALKEAGVTISNEDALVAELEKAEDRNVIFEKICVQGRSVANVTFTASLNGDGKKLSKAFADFGFDGFTFRTFLNNLKTEA